MSEIAKRGAPTLADVEARIDIAMAKGEAAFRELSQLVATVHHQGLWKQATIPVGPDTEERRPCKTFVEWCEVCREKSKTWGYQLLSAAAYSAIAENEAQARELTGLSKEVAAAIVDLATEGGTRQTTAEELRRLRASDAIAKAREGKARDGKQLRALQAKDWIERVEGKAEALRKALRQEVGTEAAEAHLEKCLEECRQLAA